MVGGRLALCYMRSLMQNFKDLAITPTRKYPMSTNAATTEKTLRYTVVDQATGKHYSSTGKHRYITYPKQKVSRVR